MSTPLTIENVWIAVATEPNGDEGVAAMLMGDHWLPLMASDRGRLEWVIEMAEKIAIAQHRTIKIVRLTERSVVKTIKGGDR